jgi:hypothetical protein
MDFIYRKFKVCIKIHAKKLKITPILDTVLEYNKTWVKRE